MPPYIETLAVAHRRSTLRFGTKLNPALNGELRPAYGRDVTRAVATDFLDGVIIDSSGLPGNCFKAVREASYVLFDLGIDHVVTVGNVTVGSLQYFETTQDSIEAELAEGFRHDKPANAHSWLTLDSGQVLDPTILASWAYHRQGRLIPIEEAIYLSGQPVEPPLTHHPFLTGFAYHLRVVSHPALLDSYSTYLQWAYDTAVYKGRIQELRGDG